MVIWGQRTEDGLLLVGDTGILGVIGGTDNDETLLELEGRSADTGDCSLTSGRVTSLS